MLKSWCKVVVLAFSLRRGMEVKIIPNRSLDLGLLKLFAALA